MSSIIIINAANRIQETDGDQLENSTLVPKTRGVFGGIKSTLSRLGPLIALSAVVDMLRLSNSYFFTSIRGKSSDISSETLPSTDIKDTPAPSWLKTVLKGSLVGVGTVTSSSNSIESEKETMDILDSMVV